MVLQEGDRMNGDISKVDISVSFLEHLRKVVVLPPPDGRECQLIWARKMFSDNDIYEFSLRPIDTDGYTCWYAHVNDKGVEWICCSLTLTLETMAIKAKEEEINERNQRTD